MFYMKILIVKLSAIGDVIHTLPALNAIRKQFPDAHITWLVESAAAGIVMEHQSIDRVIISRRKELIPLLFSSSCISALHQIRAFIKELRDTKYDLVIDFQALLKSAAMVLLCRGRIKAGFDKGMDHAECSYLFYNKKIAPVNMEIHAIKRNMMFIESLGVYSDLIEYKLPLFQKQKSDIDQLLLDHGISMEDKIVCINPQGTWQTKLWSNFKFASLTDRLNSLFQIKIVFTGGASDRETVSEIISMTTTPCYNFCGLTKLSTLAELYQRAALVITTDTGPMHIATAAGADIVAIFGPTAPWRTGPYGNHRVLQSNIECAPCFKRVCKKNNQCMEDISVEQLANSVEELWKNKPGLPRKVNSHGTVPL